MTNFYKWVGCFILAMFVEIAAFWYGLSEIYTRTGIQGFICLALWCIGAKIFIWGDERYGGVTS